jgi:hypothetical protein
MNTCPVSSYNLANNTVADTSQVTAPLTLSSTTQQVAELGLAISAIDLRSCSSAAILPVSPVEEPVAEKKVHDLKPIAAISSNLAGLREFVIEKESQTVVSGHLYAQQKISKLLERLPKSLAKPLRVYMGGEQARFEVKNSTQPKIASPQKKLMEKILKDYQDKYNIQIELCEEIHLKERLKSLQSSGKEELIGLIVTGERCEKGHVVPLLCHFIPGQNSETVILDVASERRVEPLEFVAKACLNMEKMITYVGVLSRQVDEWSCRTDAMCTLRNAMLYIQLKKEQNCFQRIGDFLPIIKVPEQQDGKFYGIEIPPEWDYTSQISNKQENAAQKLVVRDCFSKKRDRSNPRTIEQFRAEHKIQALSSCKITLYKPEDSFNLQNFKTLQTFPTTELPEGVKMTLSKYDQIHIEWSEKNSINDYLVAKGYKNLKKI